MSSLSREELVLLNSFIYLNIWDQGYKNLGDAVNDILTTPGMFEQITEGNPAGMGPDNWKEGFQSIQSSSKLCSLVIKAESQNMGYDSRGLNATCFIDKETKEATFVIRGTGRGEWLDNGIAFSGIESPQQVEALEYFERAVRDLKLQEKGYAIDVTGHSKGGNKAQYITIRNDAVRECTSFDGQGFSDEALKRYSFGIERNRHKITTIAADKDYVHCLGNQIAARRILYETKYTKLQYGLNHCPDAIIRSGRLQPGVSRQYWVNKMINLYSVRLMKLAPNIKKEVFTSFMGFAQMYLGKSQPVEGKIPSIWKANKALIRADEEFSRWFRRDRSEFTTLQKVGISALHTPIIKLVQILYTVKQPFYSESLKRSFEKILNRGLEISKRINRLAFGNSQIGKEIQKFIETAQAELKKELTLEEKAVTREDKVQNESVLAVEKKLEQVLEFEPKEVVEKLSDKGIEQMLIKRDLFIDLKTVDSLLEVADKTKDNTVKNFVKEKINEVNTDINKSLEALNNHRAINGDIKSTGLDDKIDYLLEKNNSIALVQKNGFNKNNNLEASINDLHTKIMSGIEKELVRSNETGMAKNKASEINQFCKLSIKIEENRETINTLSDKISEIEKSISKVEEKEKLFDNVEKSLKVVEQNPSNSNNKLLLFQNKSQQVNVEYEKAMSFLKSVKITSRDEFIKAKEEYGEGKVTLQKLVSEKNEFKSKKDSLLKSNTEQKANQKDIMSQGKKSKSQEKDEKNLEKANKDQEKNSKVVKNIRDQDQQIC